MISSEEVLQELREILNSNFEISPNDVNLDSNIVTDLDLDSIDAIDMVAEVQRRLECRFSPEDFKSVKTIGDIVNVILDKCNGNNQNN